MNILEIGIEHGIQRGNAETLKNVVINMLANDEPDEKIRMYTDCTQELIDGLRKDLVKP